MALALSATGLGLVKRFEGFRATPLALPQGGWLVGYGHVRLGAAGAAISKPEASDLLALELAAFERLVNEAVTAPIRQSQFDALVSFAFSIGKEAFVASSVLRRVNAEEFLAAALALEAWRKADVDGALKTVEPLVRRRAAEKALFLKDLPLSPIPSVLLRAQLDHAATLLSAPSPRPEATRPSAAQVITQILRSEPATETLLLTHAEPAEERELTTAHARPAARSQERLARGFDFQRAFENAGLTALLLFGLGMMLIGGSILIGGRGDGLSFFSGAAVFLPGLGAASVAAG
jgi:lysozyme